MNQTMNRAAIEKRLDGYWKMEAANVVFIPATIGILAIASQWHLGLATMGTLVPVCLLLVIGAVYWRDKLAQLRERSPHPRSIGALARLQLPSLALSLIAIVIVVLAWTVEGVAASKADKVVATICAILAALEYVNYYHRQLQHFDHLPDIKRLMSGRGFRRSQMAVDIARWRELQ